MANYQITSPDGTKYQVTAPDSATQDEVMARVQAQHQVSGNSAQTKIPGYQASDTGQFTSTEPQSPIKNAIAYVAADTLRHQGLPLDTASSAINAVTDIPRQMLSQKADQFNSILGAVNKMQGKPQGNYGAQSNALLQAGSDIVGNLLPMFMTPEAEAPKAAILLEKTPFQLARESGYSIMPSEAAIKGGNAVGGKVVEGLAGSAKTGVDATVKNQAVTNRLAAQEIGVPAGTPLTDTVLDNLRKPLNAVYDKVSQLGSIPTDKAYFTDLNEVGRTPGNSFPGASDPDIAKLKETYAVPHFDAGDAVLQIRNLRRNATANYKAASANQVKNAPMLGELADAQQGIADALENQLERFVGSPGDKLGNPKLIADWRNARQGLAKINSVDNAIKEGTTDVSAPALAKQANKGAPLSGNLRTIADTANAFPISVRDIGAVRNKVPINALEGLMGTGGIGAALLGSPHAAAGLATGMIARPLARASLLSGPLQNAMLPKAVNPFLYGLKNPLLTGAITQGNK